MDQLYDNVIFYRKLTITKRLAIMHSCPECGQNLPNVGKKCPHCDHRFTDEEKAAFKAKQKEYAFGCLGLVILMIIIGAIASCMGDDDGKDLSLGHKLAILNSNERVSKDDATVRRFAYLLDEIAEKTGYDKQRIADVTYGGVEMLKKKYGIEVGLLNFMEEANTALGEGNEMNIRYEDVVTGMIITISSEAGQ
ncbi:hypothetical protein [Ruficoccus sp. ZRK36]|uniref:hypothetical protein n=1 Tax=Ruficoccus sp. ZRK36 TaxID=2866311 RepID=UPI001C72A749|nr:hypothetical protein [Ruficoccus sp. ZRK36]QYY34994.1 hypothetical protein K0V07_11860 [Ruficoccus sp. ZRK36]